jgi:hypothetical protein
MADCRKSFGPLAPLIGVWTGTGVDIAPNGKGGKSSTPFLQQITLEVIPLLTFGGQTVRASRYKCLDWGIEEEPKPQSMVPVYEENGYFLWFPESNAIVLQISNPRGLSIMASGSPKPDDSFTVTADPEHVRMTGALQTFQHVVGYAASVEYLGADSIRYTNDTLLKLPDHSVFHQTDTTTLRRFP